MNFVTMIDARVIASNKQQIPKENSELAEDEPGRTTEPAEDELGCTT